MSRKENNKSVVSELRLADYGTTEVAIFGRSLFENRSSGLPCAEPYFGTLQRADGLRALGAATGSVRPDLVVQLVV